MQALNEPESKSGNAKTLFMTARKAELATPGLDKKTIRTLVEKEWLDMSPFAKEKWTMLAKQNRDTMKKEPKPRKEGERAMTEMVLELMKRVQALEEKNAIYLNRIEQLEEKNTATAKRTEVLRQKLMDEWTA